MKPKLKLIKNNIFLSLILRDSIRAITLSPFGIYFKSEKTMKSLRTVNHEKIHWQQQLEMLIIPFYLWYFIEWIIRIFGSANAYRNLSFEREAYGNDGNMNYLETRKRYCWIKYIIKKK